MRTCRLSRAGRLELADPYLVRAGTELGIRILDERAVEILWIDRELELNTAPLAVDAGPQPANFEGVEREPARSGRDRPVGIAAPVELNVGFGREFERRGRFGRLLRSLTCQARTRDYQTECEKGVRESAHRAARNACRTSAARVWTYVRRLVTACVNSAGD